MSFHKSFSDICSFSFTFGVVSSLSVDGLCGLCRKLLHFSFYFQQNFYPRSKQFLAILNDAKLTFYFNISCHVFKRLWLMKAILLTQHCHSRFPKRKTTVFALKLHKGALNPFVCQFMQTCLFLSKHTLFQLSDH